MMGYNKFCVRVCGSMYLDVFILSLHSRIFVAITSYGRYSYIKLWV
jgi:hypothetical protein